ncbi:MAG: hypothetical protein KAX15_03385, partial [Candidatus Omnitrophica bacterium]|nr:hypothetical protein [Candidatus Omnitrophota bacterium]
LRLALSSYIRSKSASFLPTTIGYINNAKLQYNNNKGFYVSIAPVPVLAHLSGHVARELFFIDAFPQMGAGGRLTRAKPVRIIPRGRETGEEVRVSVLLPPLKQGRKLQLPNIMNGSVYDFGFKRYGLKVDQQGLLTSEKGTSDYIRITYTIKKMTENSRLYFSKEETNWMKAESAAIPEPIKEGLQLAKRSSMSGQQKMELVVSIINKYFAYQTGKIKIALPQGRTWGQFLERYILENKRLLCDCDILAAYSSIFARELGLENAVLIGYANTSDLSRLISDENHAALAVKIEGKWLIFEPTLYTLRAYGIRPDSSSILEQDIKDLEVRLKVFRKDLKKNAAKIRKIEKKIKRLQRAQKREDRKKPLLATRHKVDFFNISKDLAQRLDKKLDYAVGIFRGGKVFPPLLSGYGMPVPGQTNLGELIDYIKTIGIKIGISGINAASLEHLLVQLTDKDPARRIEAARTLGGYGPAAGQSLAALVKCLEDPGIVDEETVAAMAAESIIAISGLPLINEENIPFLIRLADNFFERDEEPFSEWERKRDDFIKMGDPVQEELLKTARTHPVPATRMFALKMLEPFAHQPKTIQGLIDILSLNTPGKKNSERTEIHNIFKNIAAEKKNYFLDAVPESSRENMDMLCKFLILNNEFYFLNTSKLLKNQVKRAFLKVKKKLNKLNKEELRNKLTSLAVNTSCSSQLRIEA